MEDYTSTEVSDGVWMCDYSFNMVSYTNVVV